MVPWFFLSTGSRGEPLPRLHAVEAAAAASEGDALVLEFRLPRSSYATMAIRELMKPRGEKNPSAAARGL